MHATAQTDKPRLALRAGPPGSRLAHRVGALAEALAADFAVRVCAPGESPAADLTVDFADAALPARAGGVIGARAAARTPAGGVFGRFAIDLDVYHTRRYRSGPLVFGWVSAPDQRGADIQDLLIPAMGEEFTVAAAEAGAPPAALAHFYNQIDVLIVTSDDELQEACLAEAIACGVVPLCVGDAPALIENQRNGFVAPRSADALRDVMRWCAANADTVRMVGYRNAQLLPPALAWKKLLPAWRAALQTAIGEAALPARPRILIIVDVKGWIFERHALLLQDRLREHFDIHISYGDQPYDEKDWDLLYPLEWSLAPRQGVPDPRKWITGIRSHASWERFGAEQIGAFLNRNFSMVHAVSVRLQKLLAGACPQMRVLTHGINLGHFTPETDISAEAGAIRVGWAGNSASPVKGFQEYIQPLEQVPGVSLKYFGYSNTMLNYASMKDFYEDIDVYVCFSLTEGNNNSLMEAAAMGRAIITTDVGTVPEYLADGESALIVPRTFEALTAAVQRLRDDPALRRKLAANARENVKVFSWEAKLLEHRAFFEEALARAAA